MEPGKYLAPAREGWEENATERHEQDPWEYHKTCQRCPVAGHASSRSWDSLLQSRFRIQMVRRVFCSTCEAFSAVVELEMFSF